MISRDDCASSLTQNLFADLPTQLPWLNVDETLYSWCAAAHLFNARRTAVRTSQLLFGAPYSALSHDIPERLIELRRRTYAVLPDPMELVRKHSILGFYLPFLTRERTETVLRHAMEGAPKHIKYHLGLPASGIGALHPLKACPRCIQSDESRLGYAYWHVSHQNPATWLCLDHDEAIKEFSGTKSPRHLRRWLMPQSIPEDEWGQLPNSVQPRHLALVRLARLANASASMAPASLSADQLAKTYTLALRDRNWVTNRGSLRIRKIVQAIREHYAGLLLVPGFHVLNSISSDWAGFIGTLARRQHRPGHPFKHLLLIGLLFADWESFITSYDRAETARGFDQSAPTPTSTKPVDPRKKVFVQLVKDRHLSVSAAGREVGISATTAVRWAKLSGLCFTPRPKTLKKDVLDACRSMLRIGMPKSEIAAKTGVSITSVTRLMSAEPELRVAWKSAIHSRRRRTYRERFQS